MTRLTVVKKEVKQTLNPVWRGIGCLLIIGIFVISFILSSWLIEVLTNRENPPDLPTQLRFLPSALRQMTSEFRGQFPWFGGIGRYVPALVISLVISLLMFGVISVIYVSFRGDRTDPLSAQGFQPPGLKKRKVRKCR